MELTRAPLSSAMLRRDLHARGAQRGEHISHDATFGRQSCILFGPDATGGHGNFLTASYRRICANPAWAKRLEKSYTSVAWVPRAQDRRRRELECASSSDALLMNIFCYPRLLERPAVRGLLAVERGARPEFGVRAGLPMQNNETDRTELDMTLGNLLVEAKLTEGTFGEANCERLYRYSGLEDTFDTQALPWKGSRVQGYQLIRGALAVAVDPEARYLLLCDERRADMYEQWFGVLRAVRSCDVRSRMALLSWQELAAVLPRTVQAFLTQKYGLETKVGNGVSAR